MRLIDRRNLLSEIEDYILPVGVCEELDKIVAAIFIAPDVDAEPARHGRWIVTKKIGGYYCLKCSECNSHPRMMIAESDREYQRYCPTCGAKMDAKED